MAGPQAVDGAVVLQAPVGDQGDVGAEPLDALEIMGAEQQGGAARGELDHHVLDHLLADRIEARERLVEHHQLGVVRERGGELHPLLVAFGERGDERIGGQVEPLDPAQRGGLRLAGPWPCSSTKKAMWSRTVIRS